MAAGAVAVVLARGLLGGALAGGCAGEGGGTGAPASAAGPVTVSSRDPSDPVCTSDAQCAGGKLCIDTHCVEGRGWADGVLAARVARFRAARDRFVTASERLNATAFGSETAVAAALAADGAAVWSPGHAWRETGAARPSFRDARFEFFGDVDMSGAKPAPVPRASNLLDFTPVLRDLEALEARYVEAAADPAGLKKKMEDLDNRIGMYERSADGALHPPYVLRGFIKDAPAPGGKPYPGCAALPLRRTYAVFVYDPATGRVPLRITVEGDSPEIVTFTPEKPCASLVAAAAMPPVLHVLSQHLRALQKDLALTETLDTYVRYTFGE